MFEKVKTMLYLNDLEVREKAIVKMFSHVIYSGSDTNPLDSILADLSIERFVDGKGLKFFKAPYFLKDRYESSPPFGQFFKALKYATFAKHDTKDIMFMKLTSPSHDTVFFIYNGEKFYSLGSASEIERRPFNIEGVRYNGLGDEGCPCCGHIKDDEADEADEADEDDEADECKVKKKNILRLAWYDLENYMDKDKYDGVDSFIPSTIIKYFIPKLCNIFCTLFLVETEKPPRQYYWKDLCNLLETFVIERQHELFLEPDNKEGLTEAEVLKVCRENRKFK